MIQNNVQMMLSVAITFDTNFLRINMSFKFEIASVAETFNVRVACYSPGQYNKAHIVHAYQSYCVLLFLERNMRVSTVSVR